MAILTKMTLILSFTYWRSLSIHRHETLLNIYVKDSKVKRTQMLEQRAKVSVLCLGFKICLNSCEGLEFGSSPTKD